MNRPDPELPRRRGASALPLFGDLLALWRMLRDPEATWGWKLLALGTLAYVISPVDAFPEALMPLIAWVDDVGLVLAVRVLCHERLARYRYPLFGVRSEGVWGHRLDPAAPRRA